MRLRTCVLCEVFGATVAADRERRDQVRLLRGRTKYLCLAGEKPGKRLAEPVSSWREKIPVNRQARWNVKRRHGFPFSRRRILHAIFAANFQRRQAIWLTRDKEILLRA